MARPTLTVIAGGAQRRSPWFDLPVTIKAMSPFDRAAVCAFRVSGEDVIKAARAGIKHRLFLFWGCVAGKPPPVPGMSDGPEGLLGLFEAHACFRGVRRPLGQDDAGDGFVVYILKPRYFYRYRASMSCVAVRDELPPDVVCAVYAKLDQPANQGPALVIGTLTHWDLIDADPRDNLLPVEAGTRYRSRLW